MLETIAMEESLVLVLNCGSSSIKFAIIEPKSGELASGLDGKGRMAEPDEIVSFLSDFFQKSQSLKKKKSS